MINQSIFTKINALNGNLVFQFMEFKDNTPFEHLQRPNYFSIIWIKEGKGKMRLDFSEYDFEDNMMFAFSPYQPFIFVPETTIKGSSIYFHYDFFCILKHHREVESNGILYNNIYHPPFLFVDDTSATKFQLLSDQIKSEMLNPDLAQDDLLVSYLKIFLITAVRLKRKQHPNTTIEIKDSKNIILQKLKDAIENNFKTKHSPTDYAGMLHITPKALAKITKAYFNKTVSDIINERIMIEAKRQLYLTNKTVKEIAWDLGYGDEFYFSRFFKLKADVSPQLYREAQGFARGEN